MKPDIMDGVPEEEGLYFVKINEYWLLVSVEERNSGLTAYHMSQDPLYGEIYLDDKYTWSERIEPPEGE